MIFLPFLLAVQVSSTDIACNLHECPPSIVISKQQGDGNCDVECMSPYCNYDTGFIFGCNSTIWGDGICNKECDNPECKFDNFDCLNSTCAINCNTWMVNNSICDAACYVEECNFDGNDCDCAPGCFDSLLQNKLCDEACNNKVCDFDDGYCGYCASGCFLEMLRNEECDDVCNNYDCKYDYYACGCSDDCKVEDYGSCKPGCLVSDCQWDQVSLNSSKRCKDRDLFLYALYQQVILSDFNNPAYFSECLRVSSNTCINLEMASSCHVECLIRECNFGLCNVTNPTCRYGYNNHICEYCEFNSSCSYYSDANYASNIDIFGIEIGYTSSHKALDFYIYHVTSIKKNAFPSGDGSINSPFETLEYALQSIEYFSNEISILYLANDGNYALSEYDLLSSFKSLIITTYDENKVIIKMNGWSMVSCVVGRSLTFENVIFEGGEQYITCNDTEYCEYCSYNYYNDTDGYYYSDRNQPISQDLPVNYCEGSEITDQSLFKLQNSNLILRNVDIKNWRFNYDSIITGSGSLKLYNVNFDNIRLKGQEQNAIIKSAGLDILYIGGSVRRLNNGYEFSDSLDFRGFLYSINSLSIVIKDVEFKYNLVYLNSQSFLSSASLIYISEMQNIEIENCTFMYNYFQTGLLYSEIDVSNYGSRRNESSFLSYLELVHVYIHNASFISNYGNLGLIHIEFLDRLLNIHLQNLKFESNGVENDSIILVTNPKILNEYKTLTTSSVALSNSNRVMAILLPRWCKMTNITFKGNHAQSMITTTNLVNFELTNLVVDSNGS